MGWKIREFDLSLGNINSETINRLYSNSNPVGI